MLTTVFFSTHYSSAALEFTKEFYHFKVNSLHTQALGETLPSTFWLELLL